MGASSSDLREHRDARCHLATAHGLAVVQDSSPALPLHENFSHPPLDQGCSHGEAFAAARESCDLRARRSVVAVAGHQEHRGPWSAEVEGVQPPHDVVEDFLRAERAAVSELQQFVERRTFVCTCSTT